MLLFWFIRILLGKLPDGNYKMSRDSILAAELPCVYSRSSWKGLSPRDLLCSFCRLQRLSEPHFAISKVSDSSVPTKNGNNHDTNDVRVDKENPEMFKCDVKICSRKQEILLEYSAGNTSSKESDAVQNSALKVLVWFNNYFKKLNTKADQLCLSECTSDFKIYPNTFLQEFAMCLSVYAKTGSNDSRICNAAGQFSDTLKLQLENNATLMHVEGPDSGIFPTHGSLTCISYTVSLVMKDAAKTYLLEVNNEFEIEIGVGAVISQLESCVTQLSVNQTACFDAELPPMDLILAAASEFSHELSNISRGELLMSIPHTFSLPFVNILNWGCSIMYI
jgi:small RNA 2'-O-methyltransferase